MTLMNGKRKIRRSARATRRTRISKARRDHDQLPKSLFEPFVQPHHEKTAPTKIAQAITEEKPKIPAAIGRPRRRSACAIADRITRIRSAQAAPWPPPVYCVERYWRAPIAPPRTVSPPA